MSRCKINISDPIGNAHDFKHRREMVFYLSWFEILDIWEGNVKGSIVRVWERLFL